ncbi:hypothetical protein, partial [Vibrio anguillarum]|uniref:hypothetical protein n=5 Tax=Vibrio anguillarum TaxID=55601 RepID=UPI00399D6719
RVNTMKFINVMKKHATKIATGVTAALASASSFAEGVTDTIQAAITAGQANYTIVVVGLIALAAIGFGLRAIIRVMNG